MELCFTQTHSESVIYKVEVGVTQSSENFYGPYCIKKKKNRRVQALNALTSPNLDHALYNYRVRTREREFPLFQKEMQTTRHILQKHKYVQLSGSGCLCSFSPQFSHFAPQTF